jgi:5'-nucleotidase
MDFRLGDSFDFEGGARFVARVVEQIAEVPLPEGTLLNVNCPAGDAAGVEVTRLGKRIYRDELTLTPDTDPACPGRRRYWVYGADHGYHDEPGTDLAAVAAGRIAVTPLHFDLTDAAGMDALERHDLGRLLEPAAREVD